jgi:Zn-dependent protease with chaperone function
MKGNLMFDFATIVLLAAYVGAGQLLLRYFLARDLANEAAVARQNKVLAFFLLGGLLLGAAVLQVTDPRFEHSARMGLTLISFLAAGFLPAAQHRRATAAPGITYWDMTVGFFRMIALWLLQTAIVVIPGTLLSVILRPHFPQTMNSDIALTAICGSLGVTFAFIFYPYVVILTNRGRPISDPVLMAHLTALVTVSGVAAPRFYEIEDRLRYGNAMVTGLIRQHRFVFISDALRAAMTPAELTSILAHELAHIRYRDLPLGLARMLVTVPISVGLLAIAKLGWRRLGLPDGPLQPIIFSLCISLPLLAMTFFPYSRKREARADAAAASWTGVDTLASALTKFYALNSRVRNPDRVSRFFGTHPCLEDRLENLRVLALKGPRAPAPSASSVPSSA